MSASIPMDTVPLPLGREAPDVVERRGWRTWPWRTILFLHVIFVAANVSPDNIPFPTEEMATVNRIIESSDTGQVGRRIAFIILGVVAAYSLWAIDRHRLRIRGMLGVFMLAFFAWSCMSLAWAEDLPLTERKVLVFVLLWLGAGWTAVRLSPMNLLRFGFLSNILTLLTCLGIEVGFGRFRPWVGGYRLAGIYHPNETGQCLVVAIVAGLALATSSHHLRQAARYVIAAILSGAFLVMTGSRTSLASAACAIATYCIVFSCRNRRAARTLIIGCGLLVVLLCVGYILLGSDLGHSIGDAVTLGRKDSDVTTLTERTPLWHALIGHYLSVRPLLGYGYGAFWSTKHLVAMSLLQKGTVYFHSHSGYLEMALSIGVIGAAVHVLTLMLGIKLQFREYLDVGNPGNAFGTALLITLMVSMFTEPTNMSSYLMPTFLDMAFLMRCAFVVEPGPIASVDPVRARPVRIYRPAPSL